MFGSLFELSRRGRVTLPLHSGGTLAPPDEEMEGGITPPLRIPAMVPQAIGGHGLMQFSTAQAAGGIGPTMQLPPAAIPKRAAIRYTGTEARVNNNLRVPAVFIPTGGI